MEMDEIKIMYPQFVTYALIAAGVLLLVWRKRKKFRKGVMVANTKYVKSTTYYKTLIFRYRIYNIFIKTLCIALILISALMTSRFYKTKKHEEEIYNRDIMLCMDVSGSVFSLDAEIIDTFIDIVSRLKDERFGISAFDSAPVTILPLTNDYNYAIIVLNKLKEAFGGTSSYDIPGYGRYQTYNYTMIQKVFAGAYTGKGGSSLIGDGLAYCASTFKKGDDRTKIVILTTDNELAGNQIISVSQAASYAKSNDVKVYPIGTKTIRADKKQELVDVASTTGGVYYDFKNFSTDDIAAQIEALNKTAIIKNSYVTNHDLPEMFFPYLLYLLPVLLIFDWRVRI